MSDVRSPEEIGAAETQHLSRTGASGPTERASDVGSAETEIGPSANAEPQGDGRRGAAPSAGDSLGRFTVLEVLGQGGMGTVVSAYDPHLDRRVAIKLVSAPGARDAEHRERLLREARAMAKVRHPNVVAVHEVGEHEGQVYVAMEQVKGGTLSRALSELSRNSEGGWRQILDLFIQAGRGLAAAHAEGLVHRDFKPDNVFVDDSGRVLVGDFGLVSPLEGAASDSGKGARLREPFTRADVVVGTPAYMAPEQHRGQTVDARADQFAFCVALYEALYGDLPFPGETRLEYATAVDRGDVKPPARGRIPVWLREVVLRGLAADPNARHASMDAMLAELGADPSRAFRLGRRMRVLFVAASIAFIASWFAAVLGFDLEPAYGLYYASSIGFLGVVLGAAWFGRRALSRTSFNRAIIGSAVAVAASLVLLVAGGQLLGISPTAVGIFQLFGLGAAFLTMTASLDRRLAVAAAVYSFGFLLAAARPPVFLPTLLVAHATGMLSIYFIVATGGERGPRA